MNLRTLFNELSRAELSNLSMSNDGNGTISEANIPKLVIYTNQGLLALYTRFQLAYNQLVLEMRAHITNYHIDSDYAESNQDSCVPLEDRYIKDLCREHYIDDAIKLVSIYDHSNRYRTLNDDGDYLSIFTPQPLILQIPMPQERLPIFLTYQAMHKKLKYEGLTINQILNQRVKVPYFLHDALKNYIANKVFNHMGGQENIIRSKELELNYEKICLDVEDKDLINQTSSYTHTKLEQKGFV